jgi:transcriptional adapter 3
VKKNAAGKVESKPPVPEGLKKLVQVRRDWVSSVGERMKERPRGELVGLPAESVYQGIGDGEGDHGEGVGISSPVNGAKEDE